MNNVSKWIIWSTVIVISMFAGLEMAHYLTTGQGLGWIDPIYFLLTWLFVSVLPVFAYAIIMKVKRQESEK